MTKTNRFSTAGFTLVELSIVLVVIALIVGGVIVGTTLADNARIRSAISQLQRYDVAVTTFRGKYTFLPGDLPMDKNLAFFGGNASTPTIELHSLPELRNNNRLDSNSSLAQIGLDGFNGEARDFWTYLSEADVIENDYITDFSSSPQAGTHYPASSMDRGAIAAISSGQDNYWLMSVGTDTTDTAWDFGLDSGMRPAEAYGVDVKLDDGFVNTGNVVHLQHFGIDGLEGTDGLGAGTIIGTTDPLPDGTSCWSTAPNSLTDRVEYNLLTQRNSCHLLIKMNGA